MSAPAQSLALRGVGKRFELDGRNLDVLESFTLEVEAGDFLSIVGASGCGKTTLLRLLAGLESATAGEILVGGRPVAGPSLSRGIVFQDHRLFPWLTVEQNVAAAFEASDIPRADRAGLVREHIELVGLAGFERAYPRQLSGGMAQRAAIARALVVQPDILLLDEPLGALDAFTRLRLQRELQRIWQQKRITMVLVTHDIDEAIFLGDRVIVLQPHPGRIRRTFAIDLPRPRDRDALEFVRLRHEIYQEFE